ncbi:hypothetical protein HRI_002466600 [Hibiscus trionum]|uniref:Phytocyanin domain-containing protein n=1 Tax=Hibiscus trionum TaxID=183268 RepID=A0A9W7I2T6_HIBTR|nr:hypothetical protein HRI_002466600 [Hibiscus trionum]
MAQGRCSAMAATTVLLCLLLSLHFESARSATFTVGGSSGWTFNAAGWTKGKRFRAGDTLADIPNAFVPDVTPNTSSIPTESIPTDIVSTDIPHTSSQTTTSIPGSSASVDPDNSASIPGPSLVSRKSSRVTRPPNWLQDYALCVSSSSAPGLARYSSRKAPKGAKVFRSGKDQIKLRKGKNFFICNYIGHCQAGMKIAVIAA